MICISHACIHFIIQQTSIQFLLCARDMTRLQVYKKKKTDNPPPSEINNQKV
jgi:hypothetical protein